MALDAEEINDKDLEDSTQDPSDAFVPMSQQILANRNPLKKTVSFQLKSSFLLTWS
jgi:hypothetical protein